MACLLKHGNIMEHLQLNLEAFAARTRRVVEQPFAEYQKQHDLIVEACFNRSYNDAGNSDASDGTLDRTSSSISRISHQGTAMIFETYSAGRQIFALSCKLAIIIIKVHSNFQPYVLAILFIMAWNFRNFQ